MQSERTLGSAERKHVPRLDCRCTFRVGGDGFPFADSPGEDLCGTVGSGVRCCGCGAVLGRLRIGGDGKRGFVIEEALDVVRRQLGRRGAVSLGSVGRFGLEGDDDLVDLGVVREQLLLGLRGRGGLRREELGWEMGVSGLLGLLVLLLESCMLLLLHGCLLLLLLQGLLLEQLLMVCLVCS